MPQKTTRKTASSRAAEKNRVGRIQRALDLDYPDAECALRHSSAWELLAATILSAQCTDARVNMVTPELFARYPTVADMAVAQQAEVEEIVKTTGFFRNKAKSLIGAARGIVERFGGKVPDEVDDLLSLPGVARKTANVVLGTWFGKAEGVVVDTHVTRIARRLGLTEQTDPKKIERDLMEKIPRARWISFSHQVIHHGRRICVARKPKCAECRLNDLCRALDKTI